MKTFTVEEAFDNMGSTANQIADYFRKCDLKGKPNQVGECIIARFIKNNLGNIYWINVAYDVIQIGGSYYSTSPEMKIFMWKFDHHRYPDLIG